MNSAGFILIEPTAAVYRGVDGRTFLWPDEHESLSDILPLLLNETCKEPLDFVFREFGPAMEVKRLLAGRDGIASKYEIAFVEVSDNSCRPLVPKAPSLGVDIAYPGGDLYSALRAGLHGPNPSSDLIARYCPFLNENGLFDSLAIADDYLTDFRRCAASERDSDFVFYSLFPIEVAQ